MGELEERISQLKKQLIPESKPVNAEPINPDKDFTLALKEKLQAMKENPTLGLNQYEIRKQQFLKKLEDSKPKKAGNKPLRRDIFGEVIEEKTNG